MTRTAGQHGAEILGVGLTCAVGLRAPFAAAAVRAGVVKFTESDTFDRRGQPFVQARVPPGRLPELPQTPASLAPYETRLAQLALAAAREALGPVAHLLTDSRTNIGPPRTHTRATAPRLPVCLALPEAHPGLALLARPDPCLRTLVASLGVDPTFARVLTRGRAGGLLALAEAIAAIERGEPLALAVASDSFDDPTLLAALDQEDRVRADGVYDGFTPGEAGAAVLLAAPGTAARLGRRSPILKLAAVGIADEPGHRYSAEPHRGDGLAAAIRRALSIHDPAYLQIRRVLTGLNGEGLFAKEWGVAAIRSRDHFADDTILEHPADCLGDTGAASGLLLIALAAHWALHDPGPVLVWTASDHAPRAATVLTL